MPEMDTGFQQSLHRDDRHETILLFRLVFRAARPLEPLGNPSGHGQRHTAGV
jgi:hypothetical protein